MPADPRPVAFGRCAGAALVLACLLLLGYAAALLAEDRSAVTTLLLVFALVSVPAVVSAVLGLGPALRLLRQGAAETSTPGFAGALALGHLGIVALSLQPGLDRRLDDGDLAGAAVGATGMLAGLLVLALTAPVRRSAGVRVVGALAAGVLALALLVLRAVVRTG